MADSVTDHVACIISNACMLKSGKRFVFIISRGTFERGLEWEYFNW